MCVKRIGGAAKLNQHMVGVGESRIGKIFCIGNGQMILLHSFIKKTQKTPKAEIDLAMKRMKEVT